jgi:hypothetical protein
MIMLSWITKIKLELMAYEAMFATVWYKTRQFLRRRKQTFNLKIANIYCLSKSAPEAKTGLYNSPEKRRAVHSYYITKRFLVLANHETEWWISVPGAKVCWYCMDDKIGLTWLAGFQFEGGWIISLFLCVCVSLEEESNCRNEEPITEPERVK